MGLKLIGQFHTDSLFLFISVTVFYMGTFCQWYVTYDNDYIYSLYYCKKSVSMVMILNAIFTNILIISWLSVLLVEEEKDYQCIVALY